MQCARCGHIMLSNQRAEVELVNGQIFCVNKILLHECPDCGVEVIIIAPLQMEGKTHVYMS